MSFYNQCANAFAAPQSIDLNKDIINFQTDSDVYFPQAIQNGLLDGVMSILLPLCSFTYPNGDAGLVEIFIVLDELAKRLGSPIWHNKLTSWNEQAENLNVSANRTYRFSKYKLKLSVSKTAYPGQDVFDNI